MVLKYLKLSAILCEILKKSAVNRSFGQKYLLNNVFMFQNYINFSSLVSYPASRTLSYQISPSLSPEFILSPDFCVTEECKEPLGVRRAITTELLEIGGPKGAGFLVEVYNKDREEVKHQLDALTGEFFYFDKNILANFTTKCVLTAEPQQIKGDLLRLAKIHAITTGSEVYEMEGKNRFLFVNSADRAMRVKRMLEKLGYKICSVLFRFQPNERIFLENSTLQKCYHFLRAVEQLPKVISVTHNF